MSLNLQDWVDFFTHFFSLSLLAIGGAISTVPDMHRYLVDQQHWLSDAQFTASIALGQAAPGPNVLFIALMGWNVGLNAAGSGLASGAMAWLLAVMGVVLAMLGTLLPSTVLTLVVGRWGQRNYQLRAVCAFKQGMAPIVIALLVSTGWILASNHGPASSDWPIYALAAVTTLLIWRTRIHILWFLGAGAVLGWLGWV